MRDNRDPETIGTAILQLVKSYSVPVCLAADRCLSDRPVSPAPQKPGANGAAPEQEKP